VAIGRELVPVGVAARRAGVTSARRFCRADPGDAWKALLDFPGWIDVLDTVEGVQVDPGAYPAPGSTFSLLTGEGLRMRCRVASLEPGRRMEISVRLLKLVRTEVRNEIEPAAGGCVVSRRETYHGLLTRALAWIWRWRQREEHSAYVREWCWEAERITAVRRAGD
jgi:Polyketide cyclase / dehydrase and lipid transport